MFSRSDKTEEATDAFAEPETQRNPMVLAALAGLLAIAGAFLLVWYVTGGQDEVAEGEAETSTAAAETNRQVLVVTKDIPSGTSVTEILEAPTVYLSARAVPEEFVSASAITSVAELQDLEGWVLGSDALAGDQLLRGRFTNPSDFDGESFIERAGEIVVPPGHHAVVLELGATQALGGLLRKGEEVTIIGNFRVDPGGGSNFQLSTVVLNSVEVLSVQASEATTGQFADDANAVGLASRGSFVVTVAVEPDELTDLTFAMGYGDITLALALEGANNDDFPRAATTMRQVVGEDGVWLQTQDNGNQINLVELFGLSTEAGESIEVELPPEEQAEVDAAEERERNGDQSNNSEALDGLGDAQPGDGANLANQEDEEQTEDAEIQPGDS